MRVSVTSEIIEEMKKKFKKSDLIQELYGWSKIETRFLSDDEFKALFELAEKYSGKNSDARKLLTRLKHIKAATSGKTKKFRNLEVLTTALIAYVAKLPNKIIYMEGLNAVLLPYYVEGIKFHPYEARSEQPAHITIRAGYFDRGDKGAKTISIDRSTFSKKGITIGELVAEIIGLVPETEDLNNEHKAQVELYKEYRQHTGQQYLAHKSLKRIDTSWRVTSTILCDKDGNKLVMEDDIERGKHGPVIENDFWTPGDDDEMEQITLPMHPVMRAFDLSTHEFVTVHVDQIEPYKYSEELSEKLVLDPSKKRMIDLLVNAEHEEGGDIIKGKSGGIIILSSGAPGTGKTLTAEVYAEATKKALYVVQCSQLGTDPEHLEEKLKVVLDRATKWNVVLLIDEADVYIHERGSNLEQNAIVGVFLRLLEYYSGILFLTTNRETVVDDAIISRITAHVRYAIPGSDQQRQIWKIMAQQYKLKLADKEIALLLKLFPNISGRTIKQLARLVKVMSIKNKKMDAVDMFKEAAIYQPLNITGKEVI